MRDIRASLVPTGDRDERYRTGRDCPASIVFLGSGREPAFAVDQFFRGRGAEKFKPSPRVAAGAVHGLVGDFLGKISGPAADQRPLPSSFFEDTAGTS